MIRKIALRGACILLLTWSLGTGAALADSGARPQAVNPLGIAWKTTTNVELYGKPTGMLIAGRCNLNDPKFAQARAKGAEVLLYLNPVERPDQRVCAQDDEFYMGDRRRVPLWPYPSYGQRLNWRGTHLTDMRPDSEWIEHVVGFVGRLMRDGKIDGVFLDVVGGQLWSSLANWNSWSQSEKDAWTDGNIDLVKRLDAIRRDIDPNFIIVNNNVWHRDGDDRAESGERYVDGVAFEHPKVTSAWHKQYAAKRFGDLGHRRVLVIASNASEALQWADVPGVTDVSDQTHAQYEHPNVPVVPFHPLTDRERVVE